MKYHNELLKKLGQPEAKMYPAVSASSPRAARLRRSLRIELSLLAKTVFRGRRAV
jgi:hypothetical protein